MIKFLHEVLTPEDRRTMSLGLYDTWGPIHDERHGLDALRHLQSIEHEGHGMFKLNTRERLVLAKLYGALFAMYPKLKVYHRDYDSR